MAKRKLNYRFHNPNPVEVTADYILKVMIEANTEKMEKILQKNMVQMEANECEFRIKWIDEEWIERHNRKYKAYNFVEKC